MVEVSRFRPPSKYNLTFTRLHVLVSLAFQLPYGNEDFRLLGDTNRVYSLPIDIIAIYKRIVFCYYVRITNNLTSSAIKASIEDLNARAVKQLRDIPLQQMRQEPHQHY